MKKKNTNEVKMPRSLFISLILLSVIGVTLIITGLSINGADRTDKAFVRNGQGSLSVSASDSTKDTAGAFIKDNICYVPADTIEH